MRQASHFGLSSTPHDFPVLRTHLHARSSYMPPSIKSTTDSRSSHRQAHHDHDEQQRSEPSRSRPLLPMTTRLWHYCLSNLNFYRIHLLLFCLVPLVMAAIMLASNGEYPVKYSKYTSFERQVFSPICSATAKPVRTRHIKITLTITSIDNSIQSMRYSIAFLRLP